MQDKALATTLISTSVARGTPGYDESPQSAAVSAAKAAAVIGNSVVPPRPFDTDTHARAGPSTRPTHPNNPSTREPPTHIYERFTLYESSEVCYIVACTAGGRKYRILTIARPPLEPDAQLQITDSGIEYNAREISTVVDRLCQKNGGPGGFARVTQDFYGIVGIVRFIHTYYIILINRRSPVAVIGGHYIYHCDDVGLKCLSNPPGPHSVKESSLMSQFLDVDLTKTFYFSYTYDLTSTLQHNLGHSHSGHSHSGRSGYSGHSGHSHGVSGGVSDRVPGGVPNRVPDSTLDGISHHAPDGVDHPPDGVDHPPDGVPDHPPDGVSDHPRDGVPDHPPKIHSFSEKFLWNYRHVHATLGQLSVRSPWFVPLIHGFVEHAKVSIHGKPIFLVLIARRSRHFAGARFLKRGVSPDGHVANDVETEQIVLDGSFSFFDYNGVPNPRISSFVQVRGSIPLFWSQDPGNMSIKPQIELPVVDPFFSAAALHFDDLMSRYDGPITVLNLIKQCERVPRESKLSPEFAECINYLNEFLPDPLKITYIPYDLSAAHKSRGADIMAYLDALSEDILARSGFFHAGPEPHYVQERVHLQHLNHAFHSEPRPETPNYAAPIPNMDDNDHTRAEFAAYLEQHRVPDTTSDSCSSRATPPMPPLLNSDLSQPPSPYSPPRTPLHERSNIAATTFSLAANQMSSALGLSLTSLLPASVVQDVSSHATATPILASAQPASPASMNNRGYASLDMPPGIPASDTPSPLPAPAPTQHMRRTRPLLQRGVVRTNCIDCLDRTNTAQFVLAKVALTHQLHALGFLREPSLPDDSAAVRLLMSMYNDHGDTIALQYGGSHLVNTTDTYRKQITQWSNHSRDMVQNLKRYYSNSFVDADKQAAIDSFLGVVKKTGLAAIDCPSSPADVAAVQRASSICSTPSELAHLSSSDPPPADCELPRFVPTLLGTRRSYVRWYSRGYADAQQNGVRHLPPENSIPHTQPPDTITTPDAIPTPDMFNAYYKPGLYTSLSRHIGLNMNTTAGRISPPIDNWDISRLRSHRQVLSLNVLRNEEASPFHAKQPQHPRRSAFSPAATPTMSPALSANTALSPNTSAATTTPGNNHVKRWIRQQLAWDDVDSIAGDSIHEDDALSVDHPAPRKRESTFLLSPRDPADDKLPDPHVSYPYVYDAPSVSYDDLSVSPADTVANADIDKYKEYLSVAV